MWMLPDSNSHVCLFSSIGSVDFLCLWKISPRCKWLWPGLQRPSQWHHHSIPSSSVCRQWSNRVPAVTVHRQSASCRRLQASNLLKDWSSKEEQPGVGFFFLMKMCANGSFTIWTIVHTELLFFFAYCRVHWYVFSLCSSLVHIFCDSCAEFHLVREDVCAKIRSYLCALLLFGGGFVLFIVFLNALHGYDGQ